MNEKSFGGLRGNIAAHIVLAGFGTLLSSPLAAQQINGGEAASAAPSDQIEDVVVTARKRAESVQDAPVTITNIDSAQIQEQNLNNLTTFQAKLPTFTIAESNPKQVNIGVRGIGNNGSNNDGISPSVGVFVDGVYAGRLGEVSNDYNDLASITLLSGPQGTLFGKNTAGGALLINSQAPSFKTETNAEASLGNYNFEEVKANITGAVIPDKLAVRLAAFNTQRDGYEHNTLGGASNDAHEGTGARGQLLALPSDSVTVRLIGSYDTQSYNTPVSIAWQPIPGYASSNIATRMAAVGQTLTTGPFNRNISINGGQSAETRAGNLTSQIDWDSGYGTVTSITGYRHWWFQPFNDNDATQLKAISLFGTANTVEQKTEELRWASPKGTSFDTVIGSYFSRQDLSASQQEVLGNQYSIYAGSSNAYANGLGWGSHYTTTDTSKALFAHTTWHATDKLALNAGIRETWEQQSVAFNGWAAPGSSVANVNKVNGGSNFVGSYYTGVTDVSPGGEVGVSYKFTDDILSYVEYSHGSIAKGVNTSPLSSTATSLGASTQINSEKADSVEIGTKTEWLDHHLLLNGSLYDEAVWNYQTTEAAISSTGTSSTFLANVGSVRTRGLDFQGTIKPNANLQFNAIGSYDLATYGSFHNAQCPVEANAKVCDYTGRVLPFAPRYTADLSVEYNHDLVDGVNGYVWLDYNWRSAQNLTLVLSPIGEIQSYGIANLRVGARFLNGALDLSVWTNNLFDEKYLVAISESSVTNYYAATPGAPRTVGTTLRVHF